MQSTKQGSENSDDKASPHRIGLDQSFNDLSFQSPPHTNETLVRGHLDYNGSEIKYLGATHWETILENVNLHGTS